MSFLGGSINNQTLNGIESITDGYITIQDGTISNLQALSIGGDTTVASNLYVGGRITCAYTAALNTDIPNKLYVDLGLSSLNTSQFLKLNGSTPMTGDLNMNNLYMISNLSTATPTANQAISLIYFQNAVNAVVAGYLPLNGGTMSGSLNMGGKVLTNIPYPTITSTSSDAVNKSYCDTNDDLRLKLDGSTPMTGILNMGGKIITGIPYPTITSTSSDAVNKDYVDINDALRLFKSGDTMTGSLNMTGNTILNLSTTTLATSAVNKGQMDAADDLRLKLDGTTPMTADLNMNSFGINNVSILQAGTTISLKILAATIMQIQAAKVLMSMPISVSSTIGLGNVGIDMESTKITNVYSLTSYANNNLIFNYLSGINVLPKITLTSTTTQINDGLIINSGGINMNTYSITNCPILHAGTTISLRIDTTTIMQIQAAEVLMSKPISISSTLGLGNVGINMNSTKITNVYSLTSYANNNLIFNYLSGINVLPKITLTSTKTQITDGLLINSGGIDMNSNLITSLGNGVFETDGVNKRQLDAVNNLKMNSSNGVGDGLMTLTNTGVSLKLTNSVGSGNLVLESVGNTIVSFDNITTHTPVALILVSPTSENLYFYHTSSYTPSLMLNSTSVNCYLPTKISGGLTMTTGGSSPIDMSGNNIANALITTPTIVAPIQTSTSSTYNTINNNYLNIGYTKVVSYNISTPMLPSTAYRLLAMIGGLYNKLTIYAGVWLITATFNPFCSANTPDTQGIQLLVSIVNSFTSWAAYPASNWRQMCNGTYNTSDYTYIVNTFVVTLTAQTDLYLWGVVDYSGTATSWTYTLASLRATRIA